MGILVSKLTIVILHTNDHNLCYCLVMNDSLNFWKVLTLTRYYLGERLRSVWPKFQF